MSMDCLYLVSQGYMVNLFEVQLIPSSSFRLDLVTGLHTNLLSPHCAIT